MGASAEPSTPSKTHFRFNSSYHSTVHLTSNQHRPLPFPREARSHPGITRANMGDLLTSRSEISSDLPAENYTNMQFKRDIQAQDNELKAQHNAKSPFLQLPLELKTLIYELICGMQVIHIKKTDSGLAHSLCVAERSEEEAQTMFDSSDDDYNAPNTADRHGFSLAFEPPLFYIPNNCSWLETMETGVLSCCRQMYLESRSILYCTNTFSFHSASVLSQFCLQTPRQSLDIIRSVQVDVAICINRHYLRGTWEWEKGFETITSSLKGLKRLHVGTEFRYGRNERNDPYALPAQEVLLENILQAATLDLVVATVILWDDYFTSAWSSTRTAQHRETRWTLPQKQEWSRYVRRALLHYEDRASDLASVKRKALEEGRICRL